MKITKKDLHEWIMLDIPIRVKGEIYKAHYNGKKYFFYSFSTKKIIELYEKSRGIYGLSTNLTK